MKNYDIENQLRSTASRSKRALMDEAADCIQRLDARNGMMEKKNKWLRRRLEISEEKNKCLRLRLEKLSKQVPQFIPVTERLPENAKHPDALCPEYLVSTKYGITEGWYNPNVGGWFIIMKYLIGGYIDFERGDIVSVERVKDGIVTHWMPLPEAIGMKK